MFIADMKEVAQDTLPDQNIDMFFNRWATKMADWEERAANLVR
jgi:hypothetical protein